MYRGDLRIGEGMPKKSTASENEPMNGTHAGIPGRWSACNDQTLWFAAIIGENGVAENGARRGIPRSGLRTPSLEVVPEGHRRWKNWDAVGGVTRSLSSSRTGSFEDRSHRADREPRFHVTETVVRQTKAAAGEVDRRPPWPRAPPVPGWFGGPPTVPVDPS